MIIEFGFDSLPDKSKCQVCGRETVETHYPYVQIGPEGKTLDIPLCEDCKSLLGTNGGQKVEDLNKV
jgi:hypothetical protein